MSHARARQAIETMLTAWADARPIRVAYGTTSLAPSPGETYLRAFQLPASTTCRYLGGEAYEYRGVYQVSIVSPAEQPLAVAEALIQELSELYPADLPLSRDGFEGLIVSPVEQGPAITEPATYTIPASFTYQGEADR